MRMRGLEPPRGSTWSGRVRIGVARSGFPPRKIRAREKSWLAHPDHSPDVYARIAHSFRPPSRSLHSLAVTPTTITVEFDLGALPPEGVEAFLGNPQLSGKMETSGVGLLPTPASMTTRFVSPFKQSKQMPGEKERTQDEARRGFRAS
jgi:hypothetical protein